MKADSSSWISLTKNKPRLNSSLPSPVFSLSVVCCYWIVCNLCVTCVCSTSLCVCFSITKGFAPFLQKTWHGKEMRDLYRYVAESYKGRSHLTDPNWPRRAPQTANKLQPITTCYLQHLRDICFVLRLFSTCWLLLVNVITTTPPSPPQLWVKVMEEYII